MKLTLREAISTFGTEAKARLRNVAAVGEPEEQLRTPLDHLLAAAGLLCGFPKNTVTAVGESSLSDLKTRPDFAVSVRNALVGFIEVKAPGKGADPRRFRDRHDKQQWEKLQSLPNLIYTDGNEFSLWHDGEPAGPVVRLDGDIETSGAALAAPTELLKLFDDFLRWEPIPPNTAKQLAETAARLCRLLRDEVGEQLDRGSPALTALAVDWRKMLFPEASNEQFADGYAQAVTFGLLMARARDIKLADGLEGVAKKLGRTNSLIATALRILTDDAESQETLKTSLGTLTRVLDVVNWRKISKGDTDAWLYFYEDFLAVYDNDLRKQTGSYYTPPQVVAAMVRLVDEALRAEDRFALSGGLASRAVTVADPAVGTGTFPLGILSRIAGTITADEGEGAVPGAIEAAMARLIAFEMQLGPFAVAQLRVLAELTSLCGAPPKTPLRMYVTDTLGDPYVEQESLGLMYAPIADSRRKANEVKRLEPITVVIGNPPYKEKAKGRGGWVEKELLSVWMPPADWGVGAHAKHLRNLYVYFWRWATWKVFGDPKFEDPEWGLTDDELALKRGIVCFITVAGFLNGPGFQRMRASLRQRADEIWVIDCSPEGHQPDVPTRIFQGVQQPVCIVLASRSPKADPETPATVRFRALPSGPREEKFEALDELTLDDDGWVECPAEWRAPFLPLAAGAWGTFPALEDFFDYNGSGVMPGRTWVIAPDADSLRRRWDALKRAKLEEQERLFYPHQGGDRTVDRRVRESLHGHEARPSSVRDDPGDSIAPVRYGFRSLDRQWIIPDNRLLNRPNPELWRSYSSRQVFLTALARTSPSGGPGLTATALIPDLDHYKGSFGGRVFPLWRDAAATEPNLRPRLLAFLAEKYGRSIRAEELFAYLAAVAAHPAYVERFGEDLVQPGLRIPLTADAALFGEAAELGRTVVWLHTFGERFADAKHGRPGSPPRMTQGAPHIPKEGAIPADSMPDVIEYDETRRRLRIGSGYVEPVAKEVWEYEVSGKQVLRQWFSYRRANRERPIMGDRRPPSKLGEIQPERWPAEYTTELLNVLNVLGRLVELEPVQADLLERICGGPLISLEELKEAEALVVPVARKGKAKGERSRLQRKLEME